MHIFTNLHASGDTQNNCKSQIVYQNYCSPEQTSILAMKTLDYSANFDQSILCCYGKAAILEAPSVM
jgi:hypothetical protein